MDPPMKRNAFSTDAPWTREGGEDLVIKIHGRLPRPEEGRTDEHLMLCIPRWEEGRAGATESITHTERRGRRKKHIRKGRRRNTYTAMSFFLSFSIFSFGPEKIRRKDGDLFSSSSFSFPPVLVCPTGGESEVALRIRFGRE